MKTKIFKFVLGTEAGTVYQKMSPGATILSVAQQYGTVVVWAEDIGSRSKINRKFMLLMTGCEYEVPIDAKYVGTVQLDSDAFVLHVYDCGEA